MTTEITRLSRGYHETLAIKAADGKFYWCIWGWGPIEEHWKEIPEYLYNAILAHENGI